MIIAPLAAALLAGAPIIAFETYGAPTRGNDLVVLRWSGDAWQELGAPGNGSGVVLAVGSDGKPVIASIATSPELDRSGHLQFALTVQRWDGSQWRGLGDFVPNSAPYSTDPSLVVDREGRPVIAFTVVNSGGEHVFVYRFESGEWHDLAFPSKGKLSDEKPELMLDGDGAPTIFWLRSLQGDGEKSSGLYASKLTADGWRSLPGGTNPIAPMADVYSPAAALGRDGVPIVAWVKPADASLHAAWLGAKWKLFGASKKAAAQTNVKPAVTTDAHDRIVVAWPDGPSPGFVRVQRFDDGWRDLGKFGQSEKVSLARDGDGFWLGWSDDQPHVTRWTGEGWRELPKPSVGGRSSAPVVVVPAAAK